MSPDVVSRRTRALVRVAVSLVSALAVGVAVLIFAAFGWHRMDVECRDPQVVPAAATDTAVNFSWSWSPLGFTCTWPAEDSEEVSITKLWW